MLNMRTLPVASKSTMIRTISCNSSHPQCRASNRNRLSVVCTASNQKPQILETLTSAFKRTFFGQGAVAVKRNPVQEERDQLLQLLVDGDNPEQEDLLELVEKLSAAQVPFNETLLGGGPWVVAYTTPGATVPWLATYSTAKVLNNDNEASQDYNPADRTVINKGEYFGGKVYVTASGTYEPLGSTERTPVLTEASITGGSLHFYGLDIPLPIKGKGRQEITYLDDTMRIFRTVNRPGKQLSVVQLRKDKLAELRGE